MKIVRWLFHRLPVGVQVNLQKLRGRLTGSTTARVTYRTSSLAVAAFGAFTVAYRKGTTDEDVLEDSFDNDIFLRGLPAYQPRSTDVIVDVGAHIGTFSLLAASLAPAGKVYAVEASRDTFNFLRINAALNQKLPLVPVHVALSDQDGSVTLHHDTGNWGHSIVKQLSAVSETVPCQSLNTFFAQHAIERCALVKFNCEGAEFPILHSATAETLRRIHRMLILYHCDLWEQSSELDLMRFLETHGFTCEITNKSAHRGWMHAVRADPSS